MAKQEVLVIFFTVFLCTISKSWSASSDEYCRTQQCDNDCSLSDEEATNNYVKRYGVDRLDNFIKARLDCSRNAVFKIAVTGRSGSGKSTLINTLRGLQPGDMHAASTGVTEETEVIQRHSHPQYRKLKFYDLPGVGTRNFPKEKYFELIDFNRYDFFIIVSSNRFTEEDFWLAKEVNKSGKSFFFVRSKINLDLANEKRDHPKNFNEEKVLKKIQYECSKPIRAVDPKADIFLISGLLEDRDKFDYDLMVERLISSFPSYKRQVLIMYMTTASKKGIEAKVQTLKSKAWLYAVLSGGATAVPVPGVSFVVDYMLITQVVSDYMVVLGLDDASLEKLAKERNISTDAIRTKLSGGWFGTLLKNDVKGYVLKHIGEYLEENIKQKFGSYIPILGPAYEVWNTAITTLNVLHRSLDEMSNAANMITDLIK